MTLCPCGFGEPYERCCGRFHAGPDGLAGTAAEPPSARDLMRARYSAFALGEADYLSRTWHSSTRPASLTLDGDRRWTGLEILDQTGGGMFEAEGTVRFRAHYRAGGRPGQQQENSRFVREDGRWRYHGPVAR